MFSDQLFQILFIFFDNIFLTNVWLTRDITWRFYGVDMIPDLIFDYISLDFKLKSTENLACDANGMHQD